jgi:hypothetical protein
METSFLLASSFSFVFLSPRLFGFYQVLDLHHPQTWNLYSNLHYCYQELTLDNLKGKKKNLKHSKLEYLPGSYV